MRHTVRKTRIGRRFRITSTFLAGVLATATAIVALPPLSSAGAAILPATYTAQGPAPINGGQTENLAPGNLVAGAIQTVVAHPSDPAILWVGTVNGGIWKTTNATAPNPHWVPETDQNVGLSIGALELDPTVGTNTALLAGIGRSSSFNGTGSALNGLLRSGDAGATWTPLGTAQLTGENINGVAPRGNTIVVSADATGLGGIFRSTNGGTSFTRISGTNGLANSPAFDLVGDPSNNQRLYAATTTGLFRSNDTGATWTNVTDAVALPFINGTTGKIELSAQNPGGTNVVYAGVINNGQLAALLRSTNQGTNWTALDLPTTNESGTIVGIQPEEDDAGGQGATHFSILADNTNANLVYVGGDRQPSNNNAFPNSIGATTFSGRLFRCNASLAAGSQCSAITHNGTNNNSAPHADSREMMWDGNGDLIETDDGGIYRNTDPATNNGVWQALDGDIQISEQHSCDYDNVANIVICGDQDTGAAEQSSAGSTSWNELSQGDGGYVAVDDIGGGSSVRYSSSNSLGATGFRRRTCTAANVCANSAPGFNVVGQGQTIQNFETSGAGQSTLPLNTPLVLNKVDGNRLVVASNTRLYESTDQLDNLNIIVGALPGRVTRAVAYGGRQSGSDVPGVLWYGTNDGQLFLRSGAVGNPVALPGWTNGVATDIVLDRENWATAYVTNGTAVYRTTDAGATFTNITGNLLGVSPNAQIWSLEVVPVGSTGQYAVLAGTDLGVFATQTQNLGVWAEVGSGLPNTHAFDLHFDATDNVLLVGTLGRGSWLVQNANAIVPVANLRVTKTDSPDPVKAGDELFYTVTVTNDGPGTALGPVVVDTLPAEVTYLSDSGGCSFNGLTNQLTCGLADIPNGQSKSFTIKTRVKSDAVVNDSDGTILIQNTASVGGVSVDTTTSDNTFTESTFVQEASDLKVTKLCKPDGTLDAGQTGTCTIFVDNLGPSSARDVVVRDTNVSNGAFTFGTVTPSQGTCDPPASGVITCHLGNLAVASTTETGRASVAVNVSATEAVDINDIANATAATPDPNTANNQAQGSIRVTAVTDLSITKVGPANATAGNNITYNLSITNNGPSTATGVTITDDLSAGVDVLSVSGSGGASCNAGVPGDSSRPTTCSYGNVAPAGSRTMTISVHIHPDLLGTIHNDARVSSTTFDNDLSNNLGNAATVVAASADLSITKTDSPDPVLAGNNLTYTITVTNGGPSTAVAVAINDTLAAGTSFVSAVDGNGVTACALVQPNIVSCDLATMAPATSKIIILTVKVAASVYPPGTVLTNTATVSSTTPDPVSANNSATAGTTVNTAADLWLDKTGVQRSGNPSPVITYSLIVHNDTGCESDAQSSPTPTCGAGGPSDARNITVSDHLPLDPKKLVVQFISPQCTYSKTTHTVTCSTANLPAGATVTFVIEAQAQGSVGTITNSATLSSATPDPVTANNTNAVTLVMKGGTGKR